VLTVEDWAEIRRLHRAENMPVKAIVRALGISRNTVRAALASDSPPKYERKPAGSAVDAVEPRIRELLRAYPTMPATVIAERIGWDRGLTVLKDRVRELRPAYLPPDPASRTAYDPGELAQCDFWFPPVMVPVGSGQERAAARLPVLTMVSGYSRWLSAVLVPSRHAADLFAGWWQLIQALGAVPRVLVCDGEGAIGRHRGGKSELTAECQAFRCTLGTRVIVCRPADPEAKGLVERANGYLETSFLPGRAFASPADVGSRSTARVQRFRHVNGTQTAVYSSKGTGAFRVTGSRLDLYEELGGPDSWLGLPVARAREFPADSYAQPFEHGWVEFVLTANGDAGSPGRAGVRQQLPAGERHRLQPASPGRPDGSARASVFLTRITYSGKRCAPATSPPG